MPATTEKEKTSKVTIPKIETEATLETLTQTDSLEPQRKKTERDTLHSRIILVSPYSLLNVFLESEIPRIVKGSEIEIISNSDFNKYPYINVEEREKYAKTPYWIIDFEKITAELEKEKIDKEKLARLRREGLADIIYQYEKEIREGLSFHNEFYQDNEKPSFRVTEIVSKLTQSLDQKLPNIWRNAEENAKDRIKLMDCVEFVEYYFFAKRNHILHITASKKFSEELASKHEYDKAGNFIKNSQFITEYFDKIRRDIVKLEEYGNRARLELFSIPKI